jgi:hypothetical protein
MKHIRIWVFVAQLQALGMAGVFAQGVISIAGGDINGSGGSAGFSSGLVFYNTHSATGGSVLEGVQQPYEIYVVTGNGEYTDNPIDYQVYPNPTTRSLLLKADNKHVQDLSFQILDNNGRLLKTGSVRGNEGPVSMEQFTPGSYYLIIMERNSVVKTFKIIKN